MKVKATVVATTTLVVVVEGVVGILVCMGRVSRDVRHAA